MHVDVVVNAFSHVAKIFTVVLTVFLKTIECASHCLDTKLTNTCFIRLKGIPSVAMAADVQHCIEELVPLACDLASSEEPADIRMVALQQLPDLGK
jgi:hypothetical protein